jgi:hypothetical protein
MFTSNMRSAKQPGMRQAALLLLLLGAMTSCMKSEYNRMVEEGKKGPRQDSLFLGIHFGMTRNQFYDQCMKLNRAHLATKGLKGLSVLYKIEDPVGTINMHFYPEFFDEKIYEMSVVFTYQNYSPFLPATQPDSLQVKVTKLFDQWYGKGFITVENELKKKAFVKVNGNRRVVVFTDPPMDVRTTITDLTVEDVLKKK